MTTPPISHLRLLELTAGHPLALQRLREMQAVINEAIRATTIGELCDVESDLKIVLRAGGWIE